MKFKAHPEIERLAIWALLTLLGLTWCVASQINWRSPIAGTNVISDGTTPMTSAFEFQLGAFADGFVPDADNTMQWAAHWRVQDASEYNGTNGFFSSSVVLESNDPPFAGGTSGYIWGFAPPGSDGNSEWILLRSERWRWPVASGGIGFPVDWEVDEMAIAVVGEVSGATFLMKSAAVKTGEPSPSAAWLANHFTAEQRTDPAISGWDADPDGDGVCNLWEFTAGAEPLLVDSHVSASRWIKQGASGHVLSMPISEAGRDAVTVVLQSSIDCNGWRDHSAAPALSSGRIAFSVKPDAGDAATYYRITATLR